jgi:hypothetical protein
VGCIPRSRLILEGRVEVIRESRLPSSNNGIQRPALRAAADAER